MTAGTHFVLPFLLMLSPGLGAKDGTEMNGMQPQIFDAVNQHLTHLQQEKKIAFTYFKVGKLNTRLKVADCPEPLHVESESISGPHLRVKIVCKTTNGWHVQLPVTLKNQVPTVIAKQQVAPTFVIKKGEAVIITAHQAGLVIRTRGVALTDGVKGEKISIKSLDTGRNIDAFVKEPGHVEVQLRSLS